jgi:exodeoxyribonuclease VII large subunit
LLREVTGQGPEKTLARGFAIVRTEDGTPVTSSQQARTAPALNIQFRDGSAHVRTDPDQETKT